MAETRLRASLVQRASRGIYDQNAKLVSVNDKNAVFNPKAMLESAVMDIHTPEEALAAIRSKLAQMG